MNKAFVREPNAAERADVPQMWYSGNCCSGANIEQLCCSPGSLSEIAKTAYFCDFPRCDVAYFDDFERFVETSSLRVPVWPKTPMLRSAHASGSPQTMYAAILRKGA